MSILDNNKVVLTKLNSDNPFSFTGMSLNGSNLIYNGESIDISNFNLQELLNGNELFANNINNLSPEEIFKIIRLHAMTLKSSDINNELSTKDKLEVIKKDNPLMAHISIVNKPTEVGFDEYISILGSDGQEHLFRNDRNVDVFSVYGDLIAKYGDNITPDELISEMDDKLYSVCLSKINLLLDSSQITEESRKKITNLWNQYKNDKNVTVFYDEINDIATINFGNDIGSHKTVTFETNSNGEFTTQVHGQNVSSTITSSENNRIDENSVTEQNEEVIIDMNKQDLYMKERLIDRKDFYRLLSSDLTWTNEEEKQVHAWYGYLGDLVLYEDYLMDELKEILNEFKNYLLDAEINENVQPLTIHQKEAQEKLSEFYEIKDNKKNLGSQEKIEEYTMKLTLKKPEIGEDYSDGSVSFIAIIALVILVSIILSLIVIFTLIKIH